MGGYSGYFADPDGFAWEVAWNPGFASCRTVQSNSPPDRSSTRIVPDRRGRASSSHRASRSASPVSECELTTPRVLVLKTLGAVRFAASVVDATWRSVGVNESVGVAVVNHRRAARRMTLLAVVFALLACVPGAFALEQVVDVAAVDTAVAADTAATIDTKSAVDATAAVDTTATAPTVIVDPPPPADPTPPPADPLPPEPLVTAAPLAPVVPDPVAVSPPPVDPTPVAPTPPPADPVPAAPQDVMIAVHGASPVVTGETNTITVTASNATPVLPRVEPAVSSPAAAPVSADQSTPAVSAQPATESSVITPLVVPIVQTLGPGLLAPYTSPETFGPQRSAPNTTTARPAAPHPPPPRPAQASPVMWFGGAVPTGGWSGESAGMLTFLMGLLPLGLPDGKSSLAGQTQLAVLLMGALLMLIPFFASPLRDRRRRGPRGFATLALRPG